VRRNTFSAANLRKTVDSGDSISETLLKSPSFERQYDNIAQCLGNNGQDWECSLEQLFPAYSQVSTTVDTAYSCNIDLFNEIFNGDKDLMDSGYFSNSICTIRSGPDPMETPPEVSTNERKQEAPCPRLRTFSLSRSTFFGRVDFIVQTKSSNGVAGWSSTMSLANDEVKDFFEARTIITSYKNTVAMPQVIFGLGKQADVNNLFLPTLSFRSTIPDDSRVFDVAKFGSPRDLQAMIYDKLASLNDCDTNGRSLLNVSVITDRLEMILIFMSSMLWQQPISKCANFFFKWAWTSMHLRWIVSGN
jgi:hypothetical protein